MKRTAIALTTGLALAAAGFAPTSFAAGTPSAPDQLIQGSVRAIDALKADSSYDHLLSRAKGAFIVPTMVKGALLVGANGGQGVLVRRTTDGWSAPAFLTVGSISAGLQAGGSAGQVVMLLMTDKAIDDFTQANNFSLGANAGLTVVGYSAKGQAPVGRGDVVIWSNQSGAFAGASASASDITSNKQEDHTFYGKTVTTADIVHGDVNAPHAAQPLERALAI